MIEAARWVGLPYGGAHRTWDAPDCWLLLVRFYREAFGIELDPLLGVYLGERVQSDLELRHELVDKIKVRDWLPVEGPKRDGDGILMRFAGHPIHVGVVVDAEARKMLHTYSPAHGSVVDRWDDRLWERRVLGFYRHKVLSGQ